MLFSSSSLYAPPKCFLFSCSASCLSVPTLGHRFGGTCYYHLLDISSLSPMIPSYAVLRIFKIALLHMWLRFILFGRASFLVTALMIVQFLFPPVQDGNSSLISSLSSQTPRTVAMGRMT